jgi:hypothetical protein
MFNDNENFVFRWAKFKIFDKNLYNLLFAIESTVFIIL